MLVDNYRSPPDLVSVLNRMTYNGCLVPRKDVMASHPQTIKWCDHAHLEDDPRERKDPSSVNRGEVDDVLKLYQQLKREKERNILIITFYKGQYKKLQVCMITMHCASV
jgi:hypothetical protein